MSTAIEITESNYQTEVADSASPVLIDLWAACGDRAVWSRRSSTRSLPTTPGGSRSARSMSTPSLVSPLDSTPSASRRSFSSRTARSSQARSALAPRPRWSRRSSSSSTPPQSRKRGAPPPQSGECGSSKGGHAGTGWHGRLSEQQVGQPAAGDRPAYPTGCATPPARTASTASTSAGMSTVVSSGATASIVFRPSPVM